MVKIEKIEKILCFIFTLFVLYLVNKQCSVENLINYNSFNSCNDDPNWYTLGENGTKYYCRDIGTSASCYDMDPFQQEGWEKCLNTCGNCANTEVTLAPMNNLVMNSGDSGEYFDRVNIDDTRKWVGLDIGDNENMDVRQSLTRDETDDIVDIYDRLKIVEDMYDMLLSSVSSCIDCSQYNETNCPVEDNCKIEQGNCVINESQQNSRYFRSCNGSELSCEYNVTQSSNNENSDSTTEEVSGESVTHTYVKHYCDEHGVCSILFPTYDISCDSIPMPRNSTREYPTITYEPRPSLPRKCLSNDYINSVEDNNINITPTSPEGHICNTNIDEITERDITKSSNPSNINVLAGENWDNEQDIIITTKPGMDEEFCNSMENIKVNVNKDVNDNIIDLTLYRENTQNPDEGLINNEDIDNLVSNCYLSREGGRIGPVIDRCYLLDENQVDETDDMVGKTNCATYCNSVSPLNKFITLNNNECRCYSLEPSIGDNVINPDANLCPDEYPIPFLDEGEVVNIEHIRMANINPDNQIRNMCKNYFLLETSLDGENDIGAISGMTNRVSLYDVCPTQCKAIGCE